MTCIAEPLIAQQSIKSSFHSYLVLSSRLLPVNEPISKSLNRVLLHTRFLDLSD